MRTTLTMLVALLALAGCKTTSERLGDVLAATAQHVLDQGTLQNYTADLSGQLVNPGYRASAGVEYFIAVRAEGVSGQVGLRGTGTGNNQGMSDATRAAVIQTLSRDPNVVATALGGWLQQKLTPAAPDAAASGSAAPAPPPGRSVSGEGSATTTVTAPPGTPPPDTAWP